MSLFQWPNVKQFSHNGSPVCVKEKTSDAILNSASLLGMYPTVYYLLGPRDVGN